MHKTKTGQSIIKGLKVAIAHERGEKKLRTSIVEVLDEPSNWSKKDVAQLRKEQLNISQPKLALILGVKPKTVMAWEQGLKNPSGSARRLLDIILLSPEVFNKLSSSYKKNRILYGRFIYRKHHLRKITKKNIMKKTNKKSL